MPEIFFNLLLLVLCYLYIIGVILLTGKITDRLPVNISRKFLHIMIGNLCFIIPFFSFNTFPVNFPFFVAAPFILLTLLVSPISPIKTLTSKMSGLTDVTSGGHNFGLVLYAISYTVLALLFSSKAYIIAIGILPMAYGDAAASLIGLKMGHHPYNIFCKKSVEGSIAMFCVSYLALILSLVFFSFFYPLTLVTIMIVPLAVALVAMICEALTPKGLDNLTVPLFSALVFMLLAGGI
jgi:dolichol kinase